MIFNNKKLILNIMAAGVMVYAILLLFNIFSNAIDTSPYPNEYREVANIYMTKAIVEGDNIYSLDVLSGDNPCLVYLYGPLESLIAAFFVILFNADVITIHYFIAFAAMLAGATLMALIVRDKTNTWLSPAMAFLFTIYCNWRYGYIYAAPDALGLFLLILFFYILTKKKLERKALYAAVVAILSFFTKQYFAVIAFTGLIYFLFVSKKETVKYIVSGISISAVIFAVLYFKFPLFFTYAFYFIKGPAAGIPSISSKGSAYNASQVTYIGGLFFFLFLFTLVHILVYLYKLTKKQIRIKSDFKNYNKPIIKIEGDSLLLYELPFFIQMAVSAILLYYIGSNPGAFISYYLQLFVPSLIVVATIAVDDIRIDNKTINKFKLPLLIVANLIMCIYTVGRAMPRLVVTEMSDSDELAWNELYELIDEYRDEDIWYLPLGEYRVIDDAGYIYNTGMPFVITQKYLDKYNKSELSQKLFPYADDIFKQHLQYRDEVKKDVIDGKYEMIMYMKDTDIVFTEEDMKDHYEKYDELSLKAGSWAWDVDIYLNKELINKY